MSEVRIQVDADNMLGRIFNEIERKNLPFAIVQATNATAFEIRQQWEAASSRVFDRPTRMTQRAAQYRKATKDRLYADIYLRDEASNGTPPAKYLMPQVEGGERRKKGFEVLLQQKGAMPPGMFAVAGKGADLDQHGNVRSRQVSQILSQLGARQDKLQNQTEPSTARRRAKRKRGGEYFAVQVKRGKLVPGIYERITTGFGSAVRSIFIFTRGATYRPRYNIFGLAQRAWDKLMPFYFNRELAKALESSKFRGRP